MTNRFARSFAEQPLNEPGSYTQTTVENPNPATPGLIRAVGIVGTCKAGEVGGLTELNSIEEIDTKLFGGNAYLAARAAFQGGKDLPGARKVWVSRVGQPVAATVNLGDATLTAKPAGKLGQSLKVVRTITLGVTKLTLTQTVLTALPVEIYDGLGPVLKLEYLGVAATPTADVAVATGIMTLTLVGSATVAFSSDNVPTVERLSDAINATNEWKATVISTIVKVDTSFITAGSVTLTAGVGTLGIGGKAIELALENSQLASAVATPGAATAVNTYANGGTDGPAVTTADYTAALALLKAKDIHSLVVCSGDLSIAAVAKAHCEAQSSLTERHERLLFFGLDKQNSKTAWLAALKAASQQLGGAIANVIGVEPKLYNSATEKVEVYPGWVAAAHAAGMKAGSSASVSLTYKALPIQGVNYTLEPDERSDLIGAGIMPVKFDEDKNGFVIVQGVTCYTQADSSVYRKIHGMDQMFYLQKKLRKTTIDFVGETADPLEVKFILNVVFQALVDETRSETNRTGVLTSGIDPASGEVSPAFRNLRAVVNGNDLVGIDLEAHFPDEIAFIGIGIRITPVRIVVTA